jgi:hypothetical protein
MISHIFIFGFIILLTITMEMTWPTKARSFVDGKECATVALSRESYVESITNITEENEDAKSN